MTPPDYSIYVTFMVAGIYNYQDNNTIQWITAGASYYFGNELWVGQNSIIYIYDTTKQNPFYVI